MNEGIVFEDVSRFYGDVLGVNRVDLDLEPGIIGLVGPNGAGKSTLMNLVTGLASPSRGRVVVRGVVPNDAEAFYRRIGYCTQYDAFPVGMTGRRLLISLLRVHGFARDRANELANAALDRVGMTAAADRPVDAYSKGMRQRIKLAQAICHEPEVLVLDEPLNGLDPQARAEVTEIFREFGAVGAHVLISSHILHEVDAISDRVVFLDNGYVIAEGDAPGIKGELKQYPMQIYVRSEHAPSIASRLFELGHVTEVRLHDDGAGLFARTPDADRFFLAFNRLALAGAWHVDAIGTADETVEAIYNYLVVDGAAGVSS
ncbi:MAG: ABC transporter ATP-binding protein [Gammaproteobacteria bacterium]|nr:ABC transporter ATP-binding protein [Gammaproteobacteria bacterium]